jgi:hypothetical protein
LVRFELPTPLNFRNLLIPLNAQKSKNAWSARLVPMAPGACTKTIFRRCRIKAWFRIHIKIRVSAIQRDGTGIPPRFFKGFRPDVKYAILLPSQA